MRLKKEFSITVALILVVMLLPGCSLFKKQRFKASEDMVGKLDLFESLDGLEKIDDDLKPEFAKVLNGKYTKDSIEDLGATMKMDMEMDITSEELGGLKMTVGADMLINIEYSSADKMVQMYGDMDVSALGMQVPMKMDSYIDLDEKMQYIKVTGMGQDSGWTKQKLETAEKKDAEDWVFIKEESIRELYQDTKTKAYALVMDPNDPSFQNGVTIGNGSMEGLSSDGMDLSDTQVIVTLDEGLSVAGLYTDLKDAFKSDQVECNKAVLHVTLNRMNEGTRIELPAEARDAVEDSDDGENLFDILGSETETGEPDSSIAAGINHTAGIGGSSGIKHKSSAGTDSTASADDGVTESAEKQDTGDTAGAGGAVTQAVYGNDDAVPVFINDTEITLGTTTLQEVLDRTGYIPSEDTTGLVVNRNDSELVSLTKSGEYLYLNVFVENYSNEVKPAEECPVQSVYYSKYGYEKAEGIDGILSIGGVQVGNSLDEMTAVFGTDYEVDEAKYYSYRLKDYSIDFSFNEENYIEALNIYYYSD